MRRGFRRAALLLALACPAATSAQSFEVTGRFEYEDKAWDYDGWTGERPMRPVRRADVTVLNAATGQPIGIGSTQADGSFAVSCAAEGVLDIQVRCEADTALAAGFQRLRVTTLGDSEYAFSSKVFPAHDARQSLHVGTTPVPALWIGGNEGNPFNLFDMGVTALELLTGPEAGLSPVPVTLRMVWPNPGGSYAIGSTAFVAEGDGYDDAVALHELGHLALTHWSDDDNSLGPHSFGQSDQDPRLAFSEGFATLFGGLVLEALGSEALYVDSHGGAQVGGVQLRLRLETVGPWAADCYGEADEVAVACTLYDLLDDEESPDGTPGADDDAFTLGTRVEGLPPQAAWWELVTGPLAEVPLLALQDAWDQWLLRFPDDGQLRALEAVFAARRIRFVPDSREPDGAPWLAAPIEAVTDFSWSETLTLYAPCGPPHAPGTGDEDHFAVELVAGDVIEVRTRYPQGVIDAETECDTHVELFNPSGALVASDDNSGAGRNALLPAVPITQCGTWRVKVSTHSVLRRYGQYELRIQYLKQNHAPLLVSGPSAFPPAVRGGQSTQLSALAIDPDGDPVLVYAWTPLDGGLIRGRGPSVKFQPPAVTEPAEVRVRLVVSDSHGAEAPPAEVTITVLPATGGLCEGAAAWEVLGTGKPGAGGTPVLGAFGLPIVPGTGFAMRASGLTPGLSGYLVFGFTQLGVPLDGGTLWPTPELLLPVTPDSSGDLVIPLVLPAEPLLCGLSVITQVIVPGDPGAKGPQQTAQSNGLKVTFGD